MVERILMHCQNEILNQKLRNEINKNIGFLGGNPLKNKWVSLVDKSLNGVFHSMRINNNLKDFIDQENLASESYWVQLKIQL